MHFRAATSVGTMPWLETYSHAFAVGQKGLDFSWVFLDCVLLVAFFDLADLVAFMNAVVWYLYIALHHEQRFF